MRWFAKKTTRADGVLGIETGPEGVALALESLQQVDEAGAARRERSERVRRGLVWLSAVVLFGVLIGLMIGRLVNPLPERLIAPVKPVVVPAPTVPRLLDVLPQSNGNTLVLQLLLERSVPYQRTEASGAVSLRLPGMQLAGQPQSGRVRRGGASLAWRVEAQGGDVQVLLVGMGDNLQVRDRLEPVGDRWRLWIEVPLTPAAPAGEPQSEAPLPALTTAPLLPASAPQPEPVIEPVPSAGRRTD